MLRQAFTAGLGFAAMLLLAPRLGPGGWGCYAAALGGALLAAVLGQWGVPTWLMRRGEGCSDAERAAATGVLVLGSLGVLAIGLPLAALTLQGALAPAQGAAVVMLVTVAATLPAQVALQRLELAMRFGPIASVEIAGQVLFLALALILVRTWNGPLALALAWSAQQVALAVAWLALAQHRPACRFTADGMRPVLSFGWRFTAALGIWQMRGFLAPLLLGHLCGAGVAGLVALGSRLVESAAMARAALWRVSGPAFSHLLERTGELLALEADLALAGAVLVGFAQVALGVGAMLALPWLLGEAWQGATLVMPALAAASIVGVIFAPNAAVLGLRNHSLDVALAHGVHIVLLTVSAVLILPRAGWTGWIAVELIAMCSFAVLAWRHHRRVGPVPLRAALAGGSACTVGSATSLLGWWALAAPLAWLAMPSVRRRLGGLLGRGVA